MSDKNGKVRKQFGATKLFGLLPGRATYVINEAGMVKYSYVALFEGEEHIQEILNYIKTNSHDK